jgi:dienelactone hydrolase
VHGRVYNRIIIGSLSSDDASKSAIIFGSMNAEMPLFSFSIIVPTIGLITGSGFYDGSFLPGPTGPYHVGVKSYHLIDKTRDEWFTDDETDYRELMIKVWYPTDCSLFDKRFDYMDEITFSWLRNQGPVPLISIPKDAYTFVHPYLYEDALPLNSTSYPVLLFSPGYDGVDSIYTSFIDELVSHGYVVVSMNHPFVSGVTVFPDNRTVYIADLPGNFSESREFLMRSQRTVVDDALFVLDTIEELNQTDSLLSGIFDCSRVGMFGHSFGGAATMSCCYEDERVQAGFTLDGVVYNDFLDGSISTPFLLMCAEQRFNHSSYDHVWNQFSNDAYQVGILGSAHYSYTDVGILLSHLMPFIPASMLGFGTADPGHVVEITRLFEKAFFDVYLKNADKTILVDLFDDFNDVLIKEK